MELPEETFVDLHGFSAVGDPFGALFAQLRIIVAEYKVN